MRKVSAPPAGIEEWFTPRSFNNAEDPEPIRVKLRFPTEADKRAASYRAARIDPSQLSGEMEDIAGAITVGSIVRMQEALLLRCVLEVENYLDSRGQPIKTGRDLATHGEDEVIKEVAEALLLGIALTEEEKKTSSGSSGSHGSPSPSDGTPAEHSAPEGAPKGPALERAGGMLPAMGS